jgi:hypothetical protein
MSGATEQLANADEYSGPIIDEYELALRHASVSFEQVVDASSARQSTDQQHRVVADHYYPRLLQSFAEAHRHPGDQQRGGILRLYFAERSRAGAVMTADHELFISLPETRFEDADFIEVLIRLQEVHLKARRVLDGRDLSSVMDLVFTVVAYCLSSLDVDPSATAVSAQRARVLELLKRECLLAEQKLEVTVHRRAERPYFNSMLLTTLALVAAGAALAHLLSGVHGFQSGYRFLLATAVAGSIGATISVMSRMTFGRFSLGPTILALQQDRKVPKTVLVLGAIRPLIGGVFGILFFVLQRSELLPLKPPADRAADLYFYTAVAFIAGFSERWAQSTLKSVLPTLPESDPQAGSEPRTATATQPAEQQA